MKRSSFLILPVLLFLAACEKESLPTPNPTPIPDPEPKMHYVDLGNSEVAFNKSFVSDVNGDGIKDFSITTALIGSPIEQSDFQAYYFSGAFYTFSPVDENERMPVLYQGQTIGVNSFPQYNWYNASHLVLAEKVIPLYGTPYWRGDWKDARHQYVAFSILKNEQAYYGWLELSFNREKGIVTLHRAAVSEEPGKDVKAGL